jgi:hypothetical protein
MTPAITASNYNDALTRGLRRLALSSNPEWNCRVELGRRFSASFAERHPKSVAAIRAALQAQGKCYFRIVGSIRRLARPSRA